MPGFSLQDTATLHVPPGAINGRMAFQEKERLLPGMAWFIGKVFKIFLRLIYDWVKQDIGT
ncbi:MAG: hypothetical protein J0H29_10610 [Sphingobacteriales bacterium]|nr:hypothetical protein [Sphingobacteriales bacterium]OJY86819.1 MAG: hypothetical protein BGP14_18435 [Sphingobacteriales bacterium 44-15]